MIYTKLEIKFPFTVIFFGQAHSITTKSFITSNQQHITAPIILLKREFKGYTLICFFTPQLSGCMVKSCLAFAISHHKKSITMKGALLPLHTKSIFLESFGISLYCQNIIFSYHDTSNCPSVSLYTQSHTLTFQEVNHYLEFVNPTLYNLRTINVREPEVISCSVLYLPCLVRSGWGSWEGSAWKNSGIEWEEHILIHSLKLSDGRVQPRGSQALLSRKQETGPRGNGLKLYFWWGVRLYTGERLVRHWNRLPRKVAELPSLEVLKSMWIWLVVVLVVLGGSWTRWS